MKKSFILFLDNLNVLDDLTDEEAGQLFKAIKQYQTEKKTDLKGLMKAVFTPFKTVFDKNEEEYNTIIERNRENGKKGGRPKTQNNPKNPNGFLQNPKNLDNDNENDNDNDINYPPISPQGEKVVVEENFLESKTSFVLSKIDPFTNPLIDDCFSLYKENCPNLLKLGFEPRNRQLREELTLFLQEIDCDIGYFKELCENANKLRLIANKPIDFKSMIRNHIGISNGKYVSETDFKIEELDFS